MDALDECTDSKVRSKLLKEIATIQVGGMATNILATSRFIPEIIAEFAGQPSIEIRATNADVRRYLESQMVDLPLCVQKNQSLQDTIITEIIKAVDGM